MALAVGRRLAKAHRSTRNDHVHRNLNWAHVGQSKSPLVLVAKIKNSCYMSLLRRIQPCPVQFWALAERPDAVVAFATQCGTVEDFLFESVVNY
jgi:hypothetical protein